jgi:LuxR family maltose regulon positive regulatory protein
MRWVEERGLDIDINSRDGPAPPTGAPYLLQELEQMTLARLAIAMGRSDEAAAILMLLLRTSEQLARTTSVIEILSLQAVAFDAQGDTAAALTALKRALSLAEPGGYVRIFLDEGEPMAQLLYRAAAQGIAPGYIGKLLALFPDVDSPAKDLAQVEMIEPLSDRELEVLRLIAQGLTNQEIAQRLFLSLHTVKWHAGNIFGKLGVKNRARAVAKARALGLMVA